MDIEKLIERLNQYSQSLIAYKLGADFADACMDAAVALSTLQTENEKLRAELEQVKRERNTAVKQLHGICSVCKNYSHYHNRGKCRFCMYEPARDKDANDNWEWRGTQKED